MSASLFMNFSSRLNRRPFAPRRRKFRPVLDNRARLRSPEKVPRAFFCESGTEYSDDNYRVVFRGWNASLSRI